MNLTEEGLKQIEHYADKKRDAHIKLMVQILKEIQELRALFEQTGEDKHRKGGGRD